MDGRAKNSEFDVIVIGAGFCGSVVAIKAADLGLRIKVFDSREAYPDAFRAEKLEQDQYEALEAMELINLIQPEGSNLINAVRVLKSSSETVVPCDKHRGMDYSASVNSFRSVLRDRGLLETQKVSLVQDSSTGSTVSLEDGSTLRCKLCVISTGLSKGLRKSLGLQSQAPNALILQRISAASRKATTSSSSTRWMTVLKLCA